MRARAATSPRPRRSRSASPRSRPTLGPVEVLVCAAGITDDALLLRMGEERWDAVIETNLTACYRVAKRALPAMVRARSGRIVLISSVVAFLGNAGQTNYAASKAGLIGFARSLAREVASRSITVNVVAPGLVATDMLAALGEERTRRCSLSRCRSAGSPLPRRSPRPSSSSPRRARLRDRSRAGRGRRPRDGPLTPRTDIRTSTRPRRAASATSKGETTWQTTRPSRSSRPVRSRSSTCPARRSCPRRASPTTSTPTASTWSSSSWRSRRSSSITVDETELEGVETVGQAYELVTSKL